MSDEDFRLDNPMLVRWEFASEERLEKRSALYKRLVEGIDAEELLSVSANMTRAHLAAAVPDFSEPVQVRTHHTIFVAGKA